MKNYDFYIVPTPIGNLGDITQRTLVVLNFVDLIACEDMRVTQNLLNHFNIKTKCISYHKFNEKERVAFLLKLLKDGKKIALVSDAGTPVICDPGAVIIKELRKNNIEITALPGANAIITFLSQLSREDDKFSFVGFLPKTQRQLEDIFDEYKYHDMVFYESPNRIIKTLQILNSKRENVKLALGRELTKFHEEIIEGTVSEVIEHLETNVSKGEFVGIIFRDVKNNCNIDINKNIEILQKKNFTAKDISVIISALYGLNKNDVYKLIIKK